jgi:UDP-N-acetylglucosamine pyrophosphorylase
MTRTPKTPRCRDTYLFVKNFKCINGSRWIFRAVLNFGESCPPRFLPVKKTCDLLLVMSNLYRLENGTLTMSEDRVYKTTPTVELGNQHFMKVRIYI